MYIATSKKYRISLFMIISILLQTSLKVLSLNITMYVIKYFRYVYAKYLTYVYSAYLHIFIRLLVSNITYALMCSL